ncbi:MAG: FAD-binding oxidoreductase [Thermosynechococcaceae cyanobacterium MS004]|nr:FAD-binding oxidoreductase [Thermosynechococcaceae cyanobacterium MS004]
MQTLTDWLSSIPGHPLPQLRAADQRWKAWRSQSLPSPNPVVTTSLESLGTPDWDVVICGGTLGILLGAALAKQGWRVALLERGELRGRQQEWNTSRHELQVLVELDLLTPDQLETAIASEFNPNRIAFAGGAEFWVKDVLNVGVSPVYLLDCLKQRFLALGGQLLEHHPFERVVIHPDGACLWTGQQQPALTTRLMIDAMGHGSPLVAQARSGQQPEAVCLVVGTCAQGIPAGTTGDLMVSLSPIEQVAHGSGHGSSHEQRNQCFWEAFPAKDGRTTYLFTYADLSPAQPSLEDLFEQYRQQLPAYQGVDFSAIQAQRAMFGLFPSYRHSPLVLPWARTLAVGDSSGSQSPLSFGGFGAMLRHLHRLQVGVQDALKADSLSQADLALLQPYQPNLSVTWLFQRAMSVRAHQSLDPNQINLLLSTVFGAMQDLGDPVLRPFLQDVVQFSPLYQTLLQVSLRSPGLIPKILQQVGPLALLDWMGHFAALGAYSALSQTQPILQVWSDRLPQTQRDRWRRRMDAWTYGSGADFSTAWSGKALDRP